MSSHAAPDIAAVRTQRLLLELYVDDLIVAAVVTRESDSIR